MSLYSDVLSLIRRENLLDGVHTLVVGLSGGADSVCMLDLLVEMTRRSDIGVGLHVAHLNHGLRGAESDDDERFACETAERLGLHVTAEKRDVRAARAAEGGSLEEAARRERYRFLAAAANAAGAQAVAVAHNADDQAETVILRLIRGAGLRGLRGMPLVRTIAPGSRVRLLRPLLRTRRAEILEHLRARGRAFRQDSSNRDTTLLRNRVRHHLLPLLESEYHPAFRESVLRLSRSAADAYGLLLELAAAHADGCIDGATLNAAGFCRAHDALKPLLIDRAVAAAAPRPPQLDAKHYEAVIELAASGRPCARAQLPGGIAAVRSKDAVEFTMAAEPARPPEPIEVAIEVPGETHAAAAGVIVRTAVLAAPEFDLPAFLETKTRYDEAVDFDAAAQPLVLRSRRPGDRFRPLGCSGTRKLGDFLTDLKLTAQERDKVMLIVAGDVPVWVVGYRIDDHAKVTPRTRQVLMLSVTQSEEP